MFTRTLAVALLSLALAAPAAAKKHSTTPTRFPTPNKYRPATKWKRSRHANKKVSPKVKYGKYKTRKLKAPKVRSIGK